MDTGDIQITLPASKSLSNRWLIVQYAASHTPPEGGYCAEPILSRKFNIQHLSQSDDTNLLRTLLRQLESGKSNLFFCHNAGTVARFLMPQLAITPGEHILTGNDRLKERPFAELIEALRNMGFHIDCIEQEGHLPVRIKGGMPSRKMVSVNVTQSSQFASALLFLAPRLPMGMSLTLVGRVASRPYLHLTRDVLEQAGVDIRVNSTDRIYTTELFSEKQSLTNISIESDWSAAAYFFSMAALLPTQRIRLRGLSLNSMQGDRVVADIFAQLGVTVREVKSPYRKQMRSITLSGGGAKTKKLQFNFLDYPDLFPTIAVTCAALGEEASLRGLKNLKLKESDRLSAVMTELSKMGSKMTLKGDSLTIHPSTLHPNQPVETYNDHRMAMAFAPLTLIFPDLEIKHPEVVSKSFPDFWEEFEKVQNKVRKQK